MQILSSPETVHMLKRMLILSHLNLLSTLSLLRLIARLHYWSS